MTDTPDLSLAPGCFGLAMTYRKTARECTVCPFASACEPLAAENLAALRLELGITVPAPKAIVVKLAKPMIANPQGLVNEATPKKVLTHLERIERMGISITPALAAGLNPFKPEHKQAFMRIACHLLLKIKGGFSRDFLVTCLIDKLGHTHKTAESHALQALQILEAVGAAHETNGRIQLKGQN